MIQSKDCDKWSILGVATAISGKRQEMDSAIARPTPSAKKGSIIYNPYYFTNSERIIDSPGGQCAWEAKGCIGGAWYLLELFDRSRTINTKLTLFVCTLLLSFQ